MPILEQVRRNEFDLLPYADGHPSNFRSGAPGSAYWMLVRGADVMLCRSQGRTVTEAIQCALGVKTDGWWGPRTQSALRRAVAQRGVESDWIKDGTIDRDVLQAAIWVAFTTLQSGSLQSADVIIPVGCVVPRWMQPSPTDGAYHGLIWEGALPTVTTVLPPAAQHPGYGRPVCGPPPSGAPGRVIISPEWVFPSGSVPGSATPLVPLWGNRRVVDGGGASDQPSFATIVAADALGSIIAGALLSALGAGLYLLVSDADEVRSNPGSPDAYTAVYDRVVAALGRPSGFRSNGGVRSAAWGEALRVVGKGGAVFVRLEDGGGAGKPSEWNVWLVAGEALGDDDAPLRRSDLNEVMRRVERWGRAHGYAARAAGPA